MNTGVGEALRGVPRGVEAAELCGDDDDDAGGDGGKEGGGKPGASDLAEGGHVAGAPGSGTAAGTGAI